MKMNLNKNKRIKPNAIMKIFTNRRFLPLLIMNLILVVSVAQGQNHMVMATPTIRSQVAKILLSSFGGAVLGLSTLSFYQNPQDHLGNVAIGGAVGAILGSIYVTQRSITYSDYLAGSQPLPLTVDEGFSVVPVKDSVKINWVYRF